MSDEEKNETVSKLLKSLRDQEDLEWNLIDTCFLFWLARKNLYSGSPGSAMHDAKFAMYQAMADLWDPIETDCNPYRAPELHKPTCSCKLKREEGEEE